MYLLLTDFTHCSDISIADFEKVNEQTSDLTKFHILFYYLYYRINFFQVSDTVFFSAPPIILLFFTLVIQQCFFHQFQKQNFQTRFLLQLSEWDL